MSKYSEMMGNMHMPEEQREQLREELLRQTERMDDMGMETRKIHRPIWRRYAAAAALALCLIGTATTVYAAVRYQWFLMFFDNAGQEVDLLRHYSEISNAEEVTAENDDYRFTVLNHLYSKEQQMGLIVCSFTFLTEDDRFLSAYNRQSDNTAILKKDRVITDEQEVDGMLMDYERVANGIYFIVRDKTITGLQASASTYYSGEAAPDGGYLIGIRYSYAAEDIAGGDIILSLENAGDVEKELRVVLPESDNFESIRLTAESRPGDSIVVSPIGVMLIVTDDKEGRASSTCDFYHMERMKIVRKEPVNAILDTGRGNSMGTLVSETETTYTWMIQREFKNLVDISEIAYIDIDGVKYTIQGN